MKGKRGTAHGSRFFPFFFVFILRLGGFSWLKSVPSPFRRTVCRCCRENLRVRKGDRHADPFRAGGELFRRLQSRVAGEIELAFDASVNAR